MRDYAFERVAGVRQRDEKSRVLTVPDSIQLATCLHVKEAFGIDDVEFHTFDDGKGSNYEEKAVSLLRFEEYSQHVISDENIAAVCNLVRIKPAMSQGNLA